MVLGSGNRVGTAREDRRDRAYEQCCDGKCLRPSGCEPCGHSERFHKKGLLKPDHIAASVPMSSSHFHSNGHHTPPFFEAFFGRLGIYCCRKYCCRKYRVEDALVKRNIMKIKNYLVILTSSV